MIDLDVTARGLVFQCLGLVECAAEAPGARCPCSRRMAERPDRTAQRARGVECPPCAELPRPTLGHVLGPALAKARG